MCAQHRQMTRLPKTVPCRPQPGWSASARVRSLADWISARLRSFSLGSRGAHGNGAHTPDAQMGNWKLRILECAGLGHRPRARGVTKPCRTCTCLSRASQCIASLSLETLLSQHLVPWRGGAVGQSRSLGPLPLHLKVVLWIQLTQRGLAQNIIRTIGGSLCLIRVRLISSGKPTPSFAKGRCTYFFGHYQHSLGPFFGTCPPLFARGRVSRRCHARNNSWHVSPRMKLLVGHCLLNQPKCSP